MEDKIKRAEEIAREVHKGQKRTIGRREDYIEHPKRVASHFSTPESQIIAWLHDTLEDTKDKISLLQRLHKEFSDDIVYVLSVLTKDEEETYLNYILRIKDVNQAKIIKIADLHDNLQKLPNGSLRDKYLMALYILETKSEGGETSASPTSFSHNIIGNFKIALQSGKEK